MVSQATEIRDIIQAQWSLTGRLSKVPLDNMKEIVRFFDREQVLGNEWPKAVVVKKINDTEEEDRTVFPNYIELTDKYEITLFYRVVDVQEISYSEALSDIQDMATELQRILDLTFDPATMTGPWFTANYFWLARDHVDSAQPELRRTVQLTLFQVTGTTDQVYSGLDGILIFDVSESAGDNLPGADYQYAAVTGVTSQEGFEQIPYLTKDLTLGRGVAQLGRGVFSGTFEALTFASQDNLEGTTLDRIPQMYLPQNSSPLIGEQGDVVFLYSTTNPSGSVITQKSFMKISNIKLITSDQALMQYKITGQLSKPSETTFA